MNLSDYLELVRRSIIAILICTLLGGILGFFMVNRSPAGFESSVLVYANSNKAERLPVSGGGTLAVQRMESYVRLAGSSKLGEQVVNRLHLTRSPNAVANSMSATLDKDTVLMTIRVTAPTKEEAEQIAGILPEEYTLLVRQLVGTSANDDFATVFTTVDGPSTSETRSLFKLALNTIFGLVLGAIVGLALASLRARLDRGVRSPDALRELTGLPVVGIVPESPPVDLRHRTDAEGLPRWNAYQRLALNLEHLTPGRDRRLVVVTSAVHGAGTSETAAGLAASLADYGHRVVLVDANWRDDALIRAFGLSSTTGLGDVISRSVPVSQALTRVPGDADLSVLGSGTGDGELTPVMRRELARVLADLRYGYDAVIVDCPPVLASMDAATAVRTADSVLLVTDQYLTPKDEIVAAAKTVRAMGSEATGFVQNRVVPRTIGRSQMLSGASLLPEAGEVAYDDATR